jgi:microcystin-dependent protein
MAFWQWTISPAANATADPTVNWAEGQSPSSVNDSARAMMARLAEFRNDTSGTIVTGGTSTAYTVTSNQVFDSLAHLGGAVIGFVPHTTNGATVTLAVDGLTAKPLRSAPSVELPSGVLIQGTPYVVVYNNFEGAFYLQGFVVNPYVVPIGGIIPYVGTTAPNSSFALVNGQAINRTTYSVLFGIVSTTFGTGNGSTTFNIPDLRCRTIFGLDNMGSAGTTATISVAGGNFDATVLGGTGGAQNHTLTQAELPAFKPAITITDPGHLHTINFGSTEGGSLTQIGQNFAGTENTSTATTGITAALTSNLGSGSAHTVLSPGMTLPYILRII